MASTITTSVVTGGSNSHATTSAEVNAIATDFIHYGVSGPITLNSGSGGTGSFCVNAQGTPAMFVDVKAGSAWITATPTGQTSQKLRANMSADYTSYAISSNASGSTKFDWIYLKVDPTAANAPASDASDVTSLYTSRSSSNSTDNGTPPTYGILLAVVTVANGASSITNSNISDKRTTATFRSSPAASGVNSLDISTAATSGTPTITAQGSDANISVNLVSKGTGTVQINGNAINSGAWQSYAPILTGITIGNGTSSFYYSQIGKRVLVQGRVTFGSTSSIGGTIAISLPVTAVSSRYASREPLGVGMAFHNGSGAYNMCIVTYNSTTTVHLTAITTVSGTNPVFTEIGSSRDVNASTPFSSAGTSDVFSFNFEYEAA